MSLGKVVNEGKFYLAPGRERDRTPTAPVFAYAESHGAWWPNPAGSDADPSRLVHDAGLDWRVTRRAVYTSTSDTLTGLGDVLARGYKALVRQDTGAVLAVVGAEYTPIQNMAAAKTVTTLAQQAARTWGMGSVYEPRLTAAAPHGRDRSRGVYVVDLGLSGGRSFLIARNGHGDGAALRIDYIEIDETGAVIPIDATGRDAVRIRESHLGRVQGRLDQHSSGRFAELWGERLLNMLVDWSEIDTWPLNDEVRDGVVVHLWPGDHTTDPRPVGCAIHPKEHLLGTLAGAETIGSAYRAICRYIDQDSEARERGDATKDRLERLAAGAGTRLKERAPAWLTERVIPEPDNMP